MQIGTDGGQLSDARCHPVQHVHPANGIGPAIAKKFPGIGHKRTTRGAVNDQLAERSHDEEGDDRAERVGDEDRWSGTAQAAPCSKKETDPDRPANRHHLDLAIGQGLGITLVAAIDDRLDLFNCGGSGIVTGRGDLGALRIALV